MNENLTLGRGSIRISGRKIGNAPTVTLTSRMAGKLELFVETDCISDENLNLITQVGVERVELAYEAKNAYGRNISFRAEGTLSEVVWDVIRLTNQAPTEWQTLRLRYDVDPKSLVYHEDNQ